MLKMTLDDSSLEKMSDGEPLEYSVLDAAMNSRPIEGGGGASQWPACKPFGQIHQF